MLALKTFADSQSAAERFDLIDQTEVAIMEFTSALICIGNIIMVYVDMSPTNFCDGTC